MEESEGQPTRVPFSPVELPRNLVVKLEEPVENRSHEVLEIPLGIDESALADRLNLVQKRGSLLKENTSIP